MLKRTEGEPPPERPIGELVHELVEEGKAYAKAEMDLVKAIAISKARALALPAALFGAAFVLAQAAVVAFAFGIFMVLYWLMGPILAGVAGLLIFGGLAGALAWHAIQRLKRNL